LQAAQETDNLPSKVGLVGLATPGKVGFDTLRDRVLSSIHNGEVIGRPPKHRVTD
jgi:hypothetical protein